MRKSHASYMQASLGGATTCQSVRVRQTLFIQRNHPNYSNIFKKMPDYCFHSQLCPFPLDVCKHMILWIYNWPSYLVKPTLIFSGIPRPNDQGLRIALLVSVVSGVVILVMTVFFIVCCCQERMSKKKEKHRMGRSRLVTLILKITIKKQNL